LERDRVYELDQNKEPLDPRESAKCPSDQDGGERANILFRSKGQRSGLEGEGGKFSNSLAAIEHGKQLTKKIRNERAEINRGLCIVVVDESGNEVQSRTDLFWQCSNVIWTEGASGLPQC
jgi:hypothetical protein